LPTPLLCCFELLGIIQTELEGTSRVQEGSTRAFRAAAWRTLNLQEASLNITLLEEEG